MDLITHFLVPYAILTLIKGKYRFEGAIGGISLDFDVLIVWIGILFPEFFVFSHRGITHSFIFGFLTSILFLYLLSREPVKEFWERIINRDLSINFNQTTIIVVFFGALTHLFLDFLTSKGIPLLYPLSMARYSAEIYYYLDFITLVIATVVLLMLYLRIDLKYKKIALTTFILILILFGGVRTYEKVEVLQNANLIGENYPQIYAYPTKDIFTWSVVKINSDNTKYQFFEYNNFNSSISVIKDVDAITIDDTTQKGTYPNGTYITARNAIKTANSIPQVQRFNWNSYYTIIIIKKDTKKWIITYSDLLNSNHAWGGNLTVYVNR